MFAFLRVSLSLFVDYRCRCRCRCSLLASSLSTVPISRFFFCLFDHWLCHHLCSLSLCMTEQKTKPNNGSRQMKWHRFYSALLLAFFFTLLYISTCVVLRSHVTLIHECATEEICHMFVLCCDWFGRVGQWQDSVQCGLLAASITISAI